MLTLCVCPSPQLAPEGEDGNSINLPKLPQEGEPSSKDDEYQKLEAGKQSFLTGAIPKIVFQNAIQSLAEEEAFQAQALRRRLGGTEGGVPEVAAAEVELKGLGIRMAFLKCVDEYIDVGGGALHAAVAGAIEESIQTVSNECCPHHPSSVCTISLIEEILCIANHQRYDVTALSCSPSAHAITHIHAHTHTHTRIHTHARTHAHVQCKHFSLPPRTFPPTAPPKQQYASDQ